MTVGCHPQTTSAAFTEPSTTKCGFIVLLLLCLRTNLYLHRSNAAEVLPPLDRPCDQDGGSPNSKATAVWWARAGCQETGLSQQTFQGHNESRLAMVWHPTNWTGCYCSGQIALVHTYTICVSCTRGRSSPPSTVRQRTPQLSSLYPSDKCELQVPRMRTALQVQDRPAEPLPYPQIRGTDNVILETKGPPWWWWPLKEWFLFFQRDTAERCSYLSTMPLWSTDLTNPCQQEIFVLTLT